MKPGQKVRIDVEGKTGKTLVPGMYSYHGKIVTIQKGTDLGSFIMQEIPYRWHPSFLQPLYPDGFRIKRKGKALDKAIVERAEELGFTPSLAIQDEDFKGPFPILPKIKAWFYFYPTLVGNGWSFGFTKYKEFTPTGITLDEFFSDDFPTYDEITQKDNVIGYIGEYAVERVYEQIVEIHGELIQKEFIKGFYDHLHTLELVYDKSKVRVKVGHQEVTAKDLKKILEAWNE